LAIAPVDEKAASTIEGGARWVEWLARARPIEARAGAAADAGVPVAVTRLGAAWLGSRAAAIAAPDDARRREADRAELVGRIERLRALLGEGPFAARAPAAVVDKERRRLAELERLLEQLGG
jgi:valyl-tRNA synthetase